MSFDLESLASMALFARVVQARSFTAAAAQSGIAKSAVSRRIAGLEQRLGVELLRRSTRKLALTDEGLRFYEHCKKILEAASAAEDAVSAASEVIRGKIRISAPVTFSRMYLVQALAAFLREHPEVEIDLVLDDRFVDVIEGGFDLILRIGRLKDASFVARRIATDRIVVVAAPSYLERAGIPQTPEDLVNHNCLRYTLVPASGEWRFRGDAIPVHGNLDVNDGATLVQAAIAGLGLTVVPMFMVASDVAAGRLVLVLEEHRRGEIGIHAVTAQGKGLPRRTRALLDFLSKWFEDRCWEALRERAPQPD
ncbi:LysR family transcriptional regulator [Polyangium sp. 15x6]|uniref:LysR family transcriptional regulator n=1 Tax=Polyangium sp. 15x6 TaxID=3042687 RepID=UPI00249CBBFB|nr:LysR family transcriptional regulator [Polyangium sp. 15x6]MDI3284089.1 LysR family transcriptional regulator [Polyangium sp. 15x6]